MADQARPGPGDAGGSTGLAEVLTRKASGDQIDFTETVELGDVTGKWDRGKALLKYPARRVIPLTEQGCLVAGAAEPDLDTADAGEQPGNLKLYVRGGYSQESSIGGGRILPLNRAGERA